MQCRSESLVRKMDGLRQEGHPALKPVPSCLLIRLSDPLDRSRWKKYDDDHHYFSSSNDFCSSHCCNNNNKCHHKNIWTVWQLSISLVHIFFESQKVLMSTNYKTSCQTCFAHIRLIFRLKKQHIFTSTCSAIDKSACSCVFIISSSSYLLFDIYS